MRVPGLRDRPVDVQRSDHLLAPFLADAATRVGASVTVEPAARAGLRPPIHIEDVLHEQSGYYEARAPEYDDVWFRRGRYDLGPDGNAKWFAETARLEAAVDATVTSGDVLELACGTGLFTQRLARAAHRLTAIDASAAVLAINAERVGDPRVRYQQADIFAWEPPRGRRYDHIFFGFFLSHVPPQLLDGLWERLGRWLAPGGRVSFCDDAPGVDRRPSNPGASVEDGPSWAHRRQLQDGREFTIVKVCHAPETLAEWLDDHGWRADIASTGDEFIFGTATPR
jgi:demethylmenaquinone methyltransferase/2-methoxy-6-polyprenyl-1,4-benzoquinol methylase